MKTLPNPNFYRKQQQNSISVCLSVTGQFPLVSPLIGSLDGEKIRVDLQVKAANGSGRPKNIQILRILIRDIDF